MCKKLMNKLKLYRYILLAIFRPKKCKDMLDEEELVCQFRRIHGGAFAATIIALMIGYLLACCPTHIQWHKIIPTLLIAYPVYSNKTAELETWEGNTRVENMDKLLFKTIYLVGVTWLS